MKLELEKKYPELTFNIEDNSISLYKKVNNNISTVFKAKYDQYPNCCGIVILHDFSMTYHFNTYKEAIKELINWLIEDMQLDPEEDGPWINDGPYGSIIISDTDEDRIALFKEVNFKEVNTFENPKTENTISTLIYTV